MNSHLRSRAGGIHKDDSHSSYLLGRLESFSGGLTSTSGLGGDAITRNKVY